MTALVLDQDHPDSRDENATKRLDVTPLPWRQLLIVYLIQFAEPVTAAVIYPFINQFVRATGVTGGDEQKTGYYAGMIVRTLFCDHVHIILRRLSAIYFLLCRGHNCCILGHGVRPIRTSASSDTRSSWTVNGYAWLWCFHAILVSRHVSMLSGSFQWKYWSVTLHFN